ncbi:MAG: methionine synthase [Prochlorococcus sp.]
MAPGSLEVKRTDSAFLTRLHSPQRPVLVFDGATGTSLQKLELNADDFGGVELEGCNENLVLTRPDAVQEVHRQFLEAGCDVIETNSFGAASIVLAEYGLEDFAFEINKKSALLAKEMAIKFSTAEQPRFVAGSIGPTTKLPTLGHIDFDSMRESYQEQAEGLLAGDVDLFIIETCQDVLQIKAALHGVESAFLKVGERRPLMVSVTMETTGTMLVGSDISAVVAILEPFPIEILGLNCATGPEQMKEHINYLSNHCPFSISCIPNAGLPENVGGVAHYRLKPLELKMQLMHFVEDLGVQVIGGCCGTTPDHISALAELAKEMCAAERPSRCNHDLDKRSLFGYEPAAASLYGVTPYNQDNSFLIIGERLNASGSKKVRELLNAEDWDGLVAVARGQLKENAHVLDVNVDYVGRDGIKDMHEMVSRLVTNINLPLMLDSTEWQKMEAGLKVAGGKCILNSTNYEDGEERFSQVLKLAKEFGAGVVIGTIDEQGMARTAEQKFAIAKRAYKDAVQLGIPAHEIFYDPLALPISTGIEEDRRNGLETIEAIRLIRNELSGVHIVLGVSNISFGLSPAARITLNSVFLNDCCEAGMDAAIISPAKILPLSKVNEKHQRICRDLIHDLRTYEKEACTYDPLTELTKLFEGVSTKDARSSGASLADLPIEDRLKQFIIDGERVGLNESLEEALILYQPLQIVNTFLLEGMKIVGEQFGSGQMQLPFVLQSAQTMKSAVAYLEPHMDKSDGASSTKGKFLIATVKGDVHDIGKNLVDIILTNNGYQVINLGIKQDSAAIIDAQRIHQADCIAMSGLLVKSTAFMKSNLKEFNEAGITVPVILGGAALTPKFVNKDCSDTYNGKVVYGKDAFTDLRFMDAYIAARRNRRWDDANGFLDGTPNGLILGGDSDSAQTHITNLEMTDSKTLKTQPLSVSTARSTEVLLEEVIKPPFLGPKELLANEIPFSELLTYLDRNSLFKVQWQMRKTKKQSRSEYDKYIEDNALPALERWLKRLEDESLIDPAVTYGYFPCGREGNSLIVFKADGISQLGRFNLPRQSAGKCLCISDFYKDLNDGKPTDFLPMQAVTMGERCSIFAQQLFQSDAYTDYLFFHGLTVQLSEALAEWSHARIRRECGFGAEEPQAINDLLAQRYRGCRFSFGYPACPNVGDSRQQLKWLNSDSIGLIMDSNDQLQPEQSTTALIALHSQAHYFST